jgi:hypothetical protein
MRRERKNITGREKSTHDYSVTPSSFEENSEYWEPRVYFVESRRQNGKG